MALYEFVAYLQLKSSFLIILTLFFLFGHQLLLLLFTLLFWLIPRFILFSFLFCFLAFFVCISLISFRCAIVKGSFPVVTFLELAKHQNHVVKVQNYPASHELPNRQPPRLNLKCFGTVYTCIFFYCSVNESSEDVCSVYVFLFVPDSIFSSGNSASGLRYTNFLLRILPVSSIFSVWVVRGQKLYPIFSSWGTMPPWKLHRWILGGYYTCLMPFMMSSICLASDLFYFPFIIS